MPCSIHSCQYQRMESDKIYRAAVGRYAMLGDLYNVQRDKFLGINALKKQLEVEDSIQYEKNITKIDYIETNSVREEFEKFGIDKELSLSILCGLVNLGDPPAFLNSQMKSTRSQQMTLVYTLHTKTEELDGIRSKVNTECLNCHDATHIVVGIDWGAACSITCRQDRDETADELQVKSRLKTQMDKLKIALSGESNAKAMYPQQKDHMKLSYCTYCGIRNLRTENLQSFEDVVEAAKSLPKVVSQFKEGKGIPMRYIMIPLSSLKRMSNIGLQPCAIISPTDENTIHLWFELIERVRENQQKINDLLKEVKENAEAITEEDLLSASVLSNSFESHKMNCLSKLSKVLLDSRSGKNKGQLIADKLKVLLEGDFSFEKIDAELRLHEYAMNKVKLVNVFKGRGVVYIGKRGNINKVLHLRKDKAVYVFYMDYGEQSRRPDEWSKQEKMFLKLTKAYKDDNEVQLVAVDLEFQQQLTPERGIRIEYYDHGHIICKDLVREEGQNLNICMINVNVIDEVKKRPSKRMPFEVICPLSLKGKCPVDDCQWICKRCREVVDYGIKGEFLYCKCGKSNVFDATFRCSNAKHGLSFTAFEHDYLQTQLSSLDAVKETNILILGETGVGKSTWINAIANYVAFSSLQDAIDANDMKAFIPSKFHYQTDTGATQEISVGPSCRNENLMVGQQGTLNPKEYRFSTKHHVISFIDTPGIGDVRGIEQDKENFESILDYIAYCSEIHAICILLKPQQSRLTASFRFCITELLTHLHKSAAENIIFCFTHSRSTNYRAGETVSILKSLLNEYKGAIINAAPEKLFYFDNEVFRFLACHKNGVEFSALEIQAFSGSWEKSVSETQRLLGYIGELNPHSIKTTISINRARRLIMELSKPLALIADNIQKNIDAVKAKKEELRISQERAGELQELLYLDVVNLVTVPIEHPRTVCTDASCAKVVEVRIEL